MSVADIYTYLNYLIQVLKNWWWVPLPFILWNYFKFLYLWWRIDFWLGAQKRILLEVKIPKEMLKPIRAMEQVMASIHGVVFHPPDWWELWVDGQIQTPVSFEIASIGGEIHFYLRIYKQYRDAVETSIYSQYPGAEITEVDDYVKYVPQSIPNKEWNLWATDYKMANPDDHYPIKTYLQFETEQESEEEKRVDPIASLTEALSKIEPGTQFWIQMIAEPVAIDKDFPWFKKWLKEGEKIRDKIARREETALKQMPIIQEAAQILLTGKPNVAEEKVKETFPPEMKLTPGEREILGELERKLSKPAFNTSIRFIWLGERDVWFKANFRLGFTFFNDYMTLNLNGLIPRGDTISKIHKSWFLPLNILAPRRLYLRNRKLFRNYIERLGTYFPRTKPGGRFVLNTEELASLYHFPSKAVAPAPGISRVESKQGTIPSELPMGE